MHNVCYINTGSVRKYSQRKVYIQLFMAQYRVYLIKETMLVVGTQSEPDRALEYGQTVFQRKERAFQV